MITVIDNIMGAGKSKRMISELNKEENQYRSFLWVTPYLNEIERVQQSTYRDIKTPHFWDRPKSEDVKRLLKAQSDIGITHELFKKFDDECKELIKGTGYTLIIDEAIEAVKPYTEFKSDDYSYLTNNKDIQTDSSGLIKWTGSELLEMRYSDVRTLAENKCLFKVNEKFFVWTFPADIFSLFDEVYILTYRFEGSILQAYFKLNEIDYTIKSVSQDGNFIIDYYEPEKEQYKQRFDLYEGGKHDNELFSKHGALSATWCKSSYNRQKLSYLANSIQNYIRNILNVKSSAVMWTTYKNTKDQLRKKGYANGFISCNLRGVNEYRNKTVLVYALNWFERPEIIAFFSQRGISIDQDNIALSMMLQWIWRSNIRMKDSNEKIHLYIPSKRMRELFINWLNE